MASGKMELGKLIDLINRHAKTNRADGFRKSGLTMSKRAARFWVAHGWFFREQLRDALLFSGNIRARTYFGENPRSSVASWSFCAVETGRVIEPISRAGLGWIAKAAVRSHRRSCLAGPRRRCAFCCFAGSFRGDPGLDGKSSASVRSAARALFGALQL